MTDCCNSIIPNQQKQTLIIVLLLNAIMFVAQFSAAVIGHSTSLLADSLDMLGDAITYAVSLYALEKGSKWQTGAALFKASLILLFSVGR